jgi:hypothetical protein
MAKRAQIGIAAILVIGGTIAECSAASGLRLTCIGNLTNTREDGITLGQCDLNFLSVKDVNSIEDICGIPGTIDTPNDVPDKSDGFATSEPRCRSPRVISCA